MIRSVRLFSWSGRRHQGDLPGQRVSYQDCHFDIEPQASTDLCSNGGLPVLVKFRPELVCGERDVHQSGDASERNNPVDDSGFFQGSLDDLGKLLGLGHVDALQISVPQPNVPYSLLSLASEEAA